MVSYQTWTSVAFEEARDQGLPSTQEANRELISLIAEIWNDRKDELSRAMLGEARVIASQEIDVS